MHCASEKGHIKIVELLVQAGVSLDIPTSVSRLGQKLTIKFTLLSSLFLVQGGLTVLHKACISGHVEIMQLFIRAGCNHIIDAGEKVSIVDSLRCTYNVDNVL